MRAAVLFGGALLFQSQGGSAADCNYGDDGCCVDMGDPCSFNYNVKVWTDAKSNRGSVWQAKMDDNGSSYTGGVMGDTSFLVGNSVIFEAAGAGFLGPMLSVPFIKAIVSINEDADILPNHEIDLIFREDKSSATEGFYRALEFCGIDWDGDGPNVAVETTVDYVYGPWFSKVCMNAQNVLQNFDIPAISSTTTATALGDSGTFTHFSRTISSDQSQSKAMVAICVKFGWTKVQILSANEPYSSGLATDFIRAGLEAGIEVIQQTTFDSETPAEKLGTQVMMVENSKAKVVVFTTLMADGRSFLDAAVAAGSSLVKGLPWSFIVPEGWDTQEHLRGAISGAFMTSPFTPKAGSVPEYDQFVDDYAVWKEAGDTQSMPLISYCPYAWDAGLAVGHALDYFVRGWEACKADADAAGWFCDDYAALEAGTMKQGTIMHKFMTHNVTFAGATGQLTFDEHGERGSQTWSVWNCKKGTDECDKVGTAADTFEVYDGETLEFAAQTSTAPLGFPVTTVVWDYMGVEGAAIAIVIVFWVLGLGSVIASFVLAPGHKIIRMGQYKITAISVIGLCITLTSLIFFGQDEENHDQASLDAGCQGQTICMTVGFALFFIPICAKLHRVKKIFNKSMMSTTITDMDLLKSMLAPLFFIVLLLVVFLAVDPPVRQIFESHEKPTDDPMVYHIEKYGYCAPKTDTGAGFGFAVFGLLALLVVVGSNWAWETKDVFVPALNDSAQTSVIALITCIIGIFEAVLSFMLTKPIDIFAIVSGGMIVCALASLGLFYAPRFYAIVTGTADTWTSLSRKSQRTKASGAATLKSSVGDSKTAAEWKKLLAEKDARIKELEALTA